MSVSLMFVWCALIELCFGLDFSELFGSFFCHLFLQVKHVDGEEQNSKLEFFYFL